MTTSFVEQRNVLRLRLQTHRLVVAEQLTLAGNSQNEFPRSMTMRLLTQQTSVSFLIVTEIFPRLFRYMLASSGFKS